VQGRVEIDRFLSNHSLRGKRNLALTAGAGDLVLGQLDGNFFRVAATRAEEDECGFGHGRLSIERGAAFRGGALASSVLNCDSTVVHVRHTRMTSGAVLK
jgi:hypothetical protein